MSLLRTENRSNISELAVFEAPPAASPRPLAPAAIPGKAWRRLKRWYRRHFQNRNHVFMRQRPDSPPDIPWLQITSFARFDQVPEHIRDAIVEGGGPRVLGTDRRELDQNAAMWVATCEGKLASVLFTRRGHHFKQWFVPLAEEDIVIFRVRTLPAFRGRGIAPAMMQHAMHHALDTGGRAFIDCRVYNHPSIRSIQKAGFERIATMKAIRRDTALGQ